VIEPPILQHQRHLVVASRQVQAVVQVVVDEIEAGQPVHQVVSGSIDDVVVVPERRRLHLIGIDVLARMARLEEVVGVAVALGRRVGPVQMHRHLLGQLVGLAHDGGPAAARANRGGQTPL
jgi:hypothetical protein